MNPGLSKKGSEILDALDTLQKNGGSYRNSSYYYSKDLGSDPICEGVSGRVKADILTMLHFQSMIMESLRYVIRDATSPLSNALWDSSSFNSFVVRFDPSQIEVPDDLYEDYRKAWIFLEIFDRLSHQIPEVCECPLSSRSDFFYALDNLKSDIEKVLDVSQEGSE